MMWKDDAIDRAVPEIAGLLTQDVPDDFSKIEFVGIVVDGTTGVTASILLGNGKTIYPKNFFEVAPNLKKELSQFHNEFNERGENWKAVHIIIENDGSFDIEFEYENPYRWED